MENKKLKLSFCKQHKRIHRIFKCMKQRCCNKNNSSYEDYGGRGISICNEWINGSKKFIEWALNNNYNKDLQIDRINNDGNYSPENCRFVTPTENNLNKRIQKRNKSGYVGIVFRYGYRKWQSRMNYKSKQIYLGSFPTKKQALEARNKYIIDNNLPHKIQEWKELK